MASDGYTAAPLSDQQQQPLASPTAESPVSANPQNKESGDGNNGSNGSGEGAKGTKVSRKRTKTGCLTCRKRRIKCGEERPTCNNCIKSKRVCEGYNQRVVFKDGMHGLFPPRATGAANQRFAQPFIQPAPPGPQRPIAPAPPVFRNEEPITPLDQTLPPHLRAHYAERAQNPPTYDQSRISGTVPLNPLPSPRSQDGEYQEFGSKFQDPLPSPQYPDQRYSPDRYQQTPASATASSFNIQPPPPRSANSEPNSASLFGGPQPYQQSPQQQQPQRYNGHPSTPAPPSQPAYTPTQPAASSTSANGCPPNAPLGRKYSMVSGNSREHQQSNHNYSEIFNQPDPPDSSGVRVGGSSQMPTYTEQPFPDGFGMMTPHQPEIDYDQESEDEMDEEDEEDDGEYRIGAQEDGMIIMETAGPGGQTMSTRQQISQILEPFSRHLDEHSRISFRSFLPEAGVLATYHPTLSSSPLMNPITAKIFCHFVYVLGPRLHAPQNVWSYTIPILSLQHPPLLHATLALSSLHISKLTQASSQPSLLHYHIALRRLGKAIASDRYRGHVATLAATLMLAYYETMAAEHDKWSSHIHGAKQLLKEIDFDRVTKRVELLDDEELNGEMNGDSQLYPGQKQPSILAMRKMRRQMIADDVDNSLKSYLMGGKGRRGNAQKPKKTAAGRPFTKKELDHLRLQADMFWWYSKMDCYQSLLSGCPLVLDYIHWGQCPPRARIGTLGTTYGSSDHYFLLLGRLCDFQVRDLKRKRAVLRRNGGRWVPPPEMGGPPRGHRPPQQNMPPQSPFGPPPGHGNPLDGMHFGMIPIPSGPPQIPRAFRTNNERLATDHGIPGPLEESEDLNAATDEAELEWAEIAKAFQVLQDSLGAEYQPLGIDYMTTSTTPFGSAIYYRTYSIATLQMLYNMAMLVLHRCHPSMPPIAMMATGIQARKTHSYAVDIARIVAGLVPTDNSMQINPALGASLIEATMPMFFAAVQYDVPEQREWIVKKLREINRLTGWATASRILLGCQRAWEKAAEMHQGPHYERPPLEEEAEMFYEYENYHVALQNGLVDEEREAGGEQGRFLWKVAGRRTVDAAGLLGERDRL